MIGQTERDDKGVEAQFMKKKILVLLVCSMLTLSTTVSADILDYEGTINAYKQRNQQKHEWVPEKVLSNTG